MRTIFHKTTARSSTFLVNFEGATIIDGIYYKGYSNLYYRLLKNSLLQRFGNEFELNNLTFKTNILKKRFYFGITGLENDVHRFMDVFVDGCLMPDFDSINFDRIREDCLNDLVMCDSGCSHIHNIARKQFGQYSIIGSKIDISKSKKTHVIDFGKLNYSKASDLIIICKNRRDVDRNYDLNPTASKYNKLGDEYLNYEKINSLDQRGSLATYIRSREHIRELNLIFEMLSCKLNPYYNSVMPKTNIEWISSIEPIRFIQTYESEEQFKKLLFDRNSITKDVFRAIIDREKKRRDFYDENRYLDIERRFLKYNEDETNILDTITYESLMDIKETFFSEEKMTFFRSSDI